MAKVYVDASRATYAGVVPAEFLEDLCYRQAELRSYGVIGDRTRKTFVAETHAGEVVGLAGAGPEQEDNATDRGELFLIYMVAAYKRQGVGRRLVRAVARALQADGFRSMLVWTFRDLHGARRFYESLGGELVESGTVAVGGRDVPEVCYQWRNIGGLAASPIQT